MTNLNIHKCFLRQNLLLPSSKSYANRALILGALRGNSFHIQNLPKASDVQFLVDGLKQLGLIMDQKGSDLWVRNSFPACETTETVIEVGEGGTTARFLAALLLLGKKKHTLILGERLSERPWQEFIDVVQAMGGFAKLEGPELVLQGPLTVKKTLEIDCSRTTQFASGFQLALALTDCQVIPLHMKSSISYWKMTEKMIADLREKKTYVVPLDWSSASYPVAFAALKQEYFFTMLKRDEFQADSKFLDLLTKYDLVTELTNGIRITPKKFSADITLDVSDCLDLVPTLAFFLSHIPGQHCLKGIDNLAFKESNRIQEVIKLCQAFDRTCQLDGSSLRLVGFEKLKNTKVDLALPDDHRIVMAGTLFLTFHSGGSISPCEAVHKSFPDFFQLFA